MTSLKCLHAVRFTWAVMVLTTGCLIRRSAGAGVGKLQSPGKAGGSRGPESGPGSVPLPIFRKLNMLRTGSVLRIGVLAGQKTVSFHIENRFRKQSFPKHRCENIFL